MTDRKTDAQSSRSIERESSTPDLEPPRKRLWPTYLKSARPLLAMSRSIIGARLIEDVGSDTSGDSESEQDRPISTSAMDEDAIPAEDNDNIAHSANVEDLKDDDDDNDNIQSTSSRTGANASKLRRPLGRPRGSGKAKETQTKDPDHEVPRQYTRNRKGRFARRAYR